MEADKQKRAAKQLELQRERERLLLDLDKDRIVLDSQTDEEGDSGEVADGEASPVKTRKRTVKTVSKGLAGGIRLRPAATDSFNEAVVEVVASELNRVNPKGRLEDATRAARDALRKASHVPK